MRHHEDRQGYEHARFAALRSLLQSRPGPEAWGAVCKLAQTWRGEAFEQVEQHIEDHIARWPDEARVLPKNWRIWLAHGADVPQARLVRRLQLRSSWVWWREVDTPARQRPLLTCPHLSRISHLEISALPRPLPVAQVEAFLARQPQPLTRVSFEHHESYHETEGQLERVTNLLHNLRTRELTLHLGHALTKAALRAGTPLAAHLEALTIPQWHLDRELVALLAPERLPHLKRIRLLRPGQPWGFWRNIENSAMGKQLLDDPRLDPAQRPAIMRSLGIELAGPRVDGDRDRTP